MPRTTFALALLAFTFFIPAARASHDDGPISVSVSFRAALAPHGVWARDTEFGWVWRPTRVSAGWRPYSEGHWVWTSAGWSWDCDEPWGEVVFHYGRWAYRPALGWLWIPGDVWAPAWVVWHFDAGRIGWAPAAPRRVSASDRRWVWLPDRDFGRPRVQVRRPHVAERGWTRPPEPRDDRPAWRPPPPRDRDDDDRGDRKRGRGHDKRKNEPRGRAHGHRG